jgi:hypothetical protein
MNRLSLPDRTWLALALLSTGLLAGGCRRAAEETPPPKAPAAEQKTAAAEQKTPITIPESPTVVEKPVHPSVAPDLDLEATRRAEALRALEQLGSPLVDDADRLKQLQPQAPIWIDPEKTKVVLIGAVATRQAPLELFACLQGTKEYEAVVAVPVMPEVVHTALLATGIAPGHPAQFGEKPVPPAGPIVEVTLIWKDEQGKKQTSRAQEWVRDVKSGKAMEQPWVFVGSQMAKDDETNKEYYLANVTGNLICVSNFPDSMMDVPVESTNSDAALEFDAFTERIPPRGTLVTLVLTPKK